VLLATAVVAALTIPGIWSIRTHRRVTELWIPADSPAADDAHFLTSNFGEIRPAWSIGLADGSGDTNVLRREVLVDLVRLHNDLVEMESVSFDGKGGPSRTDNYASLCFRPLPFAPCVTSSILGLWNYSEAEIVTDPSILATVTAALADQDYREGQEVTWWSASQQPLSPGTVAALSDLSNANATDIGKILLPNPGSSKVRQVLGGLVVDESGNVTGASALLHTMYLSGGEARYARNVEWEGVYLARLAVDRSPHLRVVFGTPRSASDEGNAGVSRALTLFSLAGAIMVLYVSVSLGRIECGSVSRIFRHSRVVLGVASIATVLVSLGIAFGICGYLDVPFTPLVMGTAFLSIGISVDTFFIIAQEFDRTPHALSIEARLVRTVGRIGGSIAMTSATDFAAFAISAGSSKMPALAGFCTFCVASVACNFFTAVSTFLALLVLDERRRQSGHLDLLCCLTTDATADSYDRMEVMDDEATKAEVAADEADGDSHEDDAAAPKFDPSPYRDSRLTYAFAAYVAPWVLQRRVSGAIVFVAVACAAVGLGWGASHLHGESSGNSALPDDSYWITYQTTRDKYFSTASEELNIVFGTVDYGDPIVQDLVLATVANVTTHPDVSVNTTNWLADYLHYLSTASPHAASLTEAGRPPDVGSFYLWLFEFLVQPSGTHHQANVVMQFGQIKTSRITAPLLPNQVNDLQKADTVVELREIASRSPLPDTFVFSTKFLFWEKYIDLVPQTLIQLTLVCFACAAIIGLFISSWLLVTLVIGSILLIDLDMLLAMRLLGIGLSTATTTLFLIAIGLGLDALSHICHAYLDNVREQVREHRGRGCTVLTTADRRRIRYLSTARAVTEMGSSVFSGSVTSFLGIFMLGMAPQLVLREFSQFFVTMFILSMLHGLFFVPAVLNLVGPIWDEEGGVDGVELGLVRLESPATSEDEEDETDEGEEAQALGAGRETEPARPE
jgi:Niemann-Pick C1 protein